MADAFDLSEDIAEALDRQQGLSDALLRCIADLRLPCDDERLLLALIDAQSGYRARALALAGSIARHAAPAPAPGLHPH